MSKPTLYVFAISHYCEKARWALDHLGIDYDLRHLAPGAHRKVAKELGAPGSSVPILATSEGALQGSANIIDWAEKIASKSLTPDGAREIEMRLDDKTGVHVRRYYYSEALVDHSKTVRPIFTKDLPLAQKLMVSLQWPVIRKIMIAGLDLGPVQREQSKRIIEYELNWLDGLLSNGRRHLVGDQFSRADITAASLLGPLATPSEHPVYANLALPPKLTADVEAWERHPALDWIRDIYREYR
jgi:glutathione S-transferase